MTGETTETSTASGLESKKLDENVVSVSRTTWKTDVPLYGVKELDRKIERKSNGRVVVKILGYMTDADYRKSMIAVQNEETAELAYLHFKSKKISGFPKKIDGTYAMWLKSNCAVFEIADEADGEKYAATLISFLDKLFRNILFYRCSYDGFSSIAVYNQNDYLNEIVSSLQKPGCFRIERDGGTVRLYWKNADSYQSFIDYMKNMKDSKRIAVFGSEIFLLPSGDFYKNMECRSVSKFTDLAQKNFGLSVVSSRLDFESYDDMKSYVEDNVDEFSARYFVFCTCETQAEEFGRRAWVNATVSFVLFDFETGKEYTSGLAESMQMSATIMALSDEQVKLKSKTAIDNACNPDKNPESILVVMEEIFNQIP
ncbi:MAG: hypothetical protein IKQ66_03835 [Treponema sp.]|nr:hypothetical protein [Treponema sp.]MBR6297065.1 hypothetical protein [Treponema sp.]